MARKSRLAVASILGLLFAGCSGSIGQNGASLPVADGVQTVSDAADALDTHRASASQNAIAAIGATNAFGSTVRDLVGDESAVTGRLLRGVVRYSGGALIVRERTFSKRVASASLLSVQQRQMASNAFCQEAAGYTVNGIPSLDTSFGWEGRIEPSGMRSESTRGIATWSARAAGNIYQAAIGSLTLVPTAATSCAPMLGRYALRGSTTRDGFTMPIAATFHQGKLVHLTAGDATFSSGETLRAISSGRPLHVDGVINSGVMTIGTFRTDAFGNGTLTIVSSGAQYSITDWIAVN